MVSNKRSVGASSPIPALLSSVNCSPLKQVVAKMDSKYDEGEKVLCYEPDLKKVRVIYEAIILKVAETDAESRGKAKAFQYKVHFKGWNSSWDRFVSEDCLLKDTAENRELQRQLEIDAKACLNNKLLKKKKKKKKIRRDSSAPENSENLNDLTSSFSSDQKSHLDGTPKKKKKRKRKRDRITSCPAELPTQAPISPLNKIVIVNGSKIASPALMGQLVSSPVHHASSTLKFSPTIKIVSPKPISPKPISPKPISPIQSSLKSNDIELLSSPVLLFKNELMSGDNDESSIAPNLGPKFRKRKYSSDGSMTRRVIKKRVSTNVVIKTPVNATTLITPVTTPTAAVDLPISIHAKSKPKPVTPLVQISTPISNSAGRKERIPTVVLSENLKRHLDQDFDFVYKKRRLIHLPADPNIVTVLEDFVRQYAAGRLLAYEKHQRKSMYTAYKRETGEMTLQRALESIQMCKEVAEGLRILIDFNLKSSLLYDSTNEMNQFEESIQSGMTPILPVDAVTSPSCTDMEVAVFNGTSPTDSSADSAGSLNNLKSSIRSGLRKCDTVSMSAESTEVPLTTKRRQNNNSSRRDSCETVTNNAQLGCTATSTRSSIASIKDGGGSSCSTTSRSTTTHRNSMMMPPAATCPSTPQSNKILRSIDEWRLVPPSLYQQTPIIPSLIYGPVHLLRLFVRLPEIINRMHLPPKTGKLIVKYVDAILEYLEAHPHLFSSDLYE